MLKLLLEQPIAVIESGVVIPCALQDLLAMGLDDRTCMFRSEARHSSQAVGGAPLRMNPYQRDRADRYEASTASGSVHVVN
jgi:hypothetical protein